MNIFLPHTLCYTLFIITGAIDCLSSVLEQAGSSLASLFRATVFLTDMKQYGPMNNIYGTKLGLTIETPVMLPPTRAAFCVKDLPLNGLIEIAGKYSKANAVPQKCSL